MRVAVTVAAAPVVASAAAPIPRCTGRRFCAPLRMVVARLPRDRQPLTAATSSLIVQAGTTRYRFKKSELPSVPCCLATRSTRERVNTYLATMEAPTPAPLCAPPRTSPRLSAGGSPLSSSAAERPREEKEEKRTKGPWTPEEDVRSQRHCLPPLDRSRASDPARAALRPKSSNWCARTAPENGPR